MTAEIAILNKSAVALAADSAVTIGSGSDAKIYNTVNKIFELSDNQAIALMIYGSLNFMGLPLETIAKMFRRDVGNKRHFATVDDCAVALIEYLEEEISCGELDVARNIVGILYDCFARTAAEIDEAIWSDIRRRGNFLPSKLNGIAQDVIAKKIKALELRDVSDPFSPNDFRFVLDGNFDIVDKLIERHFNGVLPKITKTTKGQMHRLAKLELHRGPLSEIRTGVVVTGFGSKDVCPSLAHFEIDGIIADKLKRRKFAGVDIGRNGVGAEVRAFAQDEMVARFLKGIDPVYEEYLNDLFEQTMSKFARQVVSAVNRQPGISMKRTALDPIATKLAKEMLEEAIERKEREYDTSILNMVEFMPKQELAHLAQSLIDVTALKRRVSTQRETVGGEVDVAVISKSEGLVWIRRKHYFPPDLNPRFYKRHYNQKVDHENV